MTGLVALLVAAAMVVLATRNPADQVHGTVNAATLRPGATFVDPRSGLNWRAAAGSWAVYQGRLAVDTAGAAISLVVTESPSTTYTVKATVPTIAPDAGLVFRYQNPSNYWAVLAQIDPTRPISGLKLDGRWRIVRMVGGVATRVADFGLFSCCQNGTSLSVSTQPDGTMLFAKEGILAARLRDTSLAQERGAGVVATTPDGQTIVVKNFDILKQVPGSAPPNSPPSTFAP